jgi:2,3-diketo-5-methylthio-1-phosphopentane phosphatase
MKILCDFDGTTAKNDVGNLFFRTFAGKRCYDIVRLWKEGKISSKECLVQECEIARITKPEFEAFVDEQELDPFFPEFVHFCRAQGFEIEIVSDGLDFYVDRIIKNHHLDAFVHTYANRLVFQNHDRITAEFPYFEDGCGRCANCKGFHVRRARKGAKKIIYIGDGLSDRCGAREADIVFAKRGRDLLPFCQEAGIHHSEFNNFQDVRMTLERTLR